MGANPTGVVIAKTSLGVTVKAKGPGFNLEECESTEELKSLKREIKGTHHGSNNFLLIQWAVQSVNDANGKDPLRLILKVMKNGSESDENNTEMDEDYERSRDHAVALSNFLWPISVDKIPEIKFVVPSEHDDLVNYLSERKRKCLTLPFQL